GAVSGVGMAAGGLAQGAGQAAAPAIEDMLPQGLRSNPMDYFADTLLRSSSQTMTVAGQEPQNNADFQRQVVGILGNLLTTGEIEDAERTWLTNQIAARTGLSQLDAQNRVNQTVERVNTLRA